MEKILLIGCGNVDRQDDGVAWHVLENLAHRLGRRVPDSPEEGFPDAEGNPGMLFQMQLTPELAIFIARVRRVCFIDAHTGRVPADISIEALECEFQSSAFTHHLTPASCLALTDALYGRVPQALQVSVRGYQFGFSHSLSMRTQELVEPAANAIWSWMQ